jgi:DNA-directed RNA polymerase subunit beta'
LGKVDKLKGFKENVIMGHLIPAGTGFAQNRNFELRETVEPTLSEDQEGDTFEALEEA